jgi:hypothetical protein
MTMTKEHARLSQCRVAASVQALNEALADAHRFGLRTVVHPSGLYGQQSVKVQLLNPVELKFMESSK